MSLDKVSIIMPTWNRAYCLWKSIQSIQNQSYSNWELIVVDDNSTDDTYKLMREFQYDPRIIYTKNELSHSPAGSRRHGMLKATGQYLAYLDSDNLAHPMWLAIIIDRFNRHPQAVFAFPELNFRILILEKDHYSVALERNYYDYPPNVINLWKHKFEGDPNGLIHRKSALEKIEGWDTNLKLFEDYDYSLQLATNFPDGMIHIPVTLIDYTRLYGETGICNDATYPALIENLEYLNQKYANSEEWHKYNWSNQAISKYKELQNMGYKPKQRIIEKYGTKKAI